MTAKGLQSIFRVTARVTPTIHGALPWFVFELVIDYGIFNSQLWGELPQFGYAKGLAADDPFSLGIPCLCEYSPHHCFCSLLYQDIVWQILGEKSRGFWIKNNL